MLPVVPPSIPPVAAMSMSFDHRSTSADCHRPVIVASPPTRALIAAAMIGPAVKLPPTKASSRLVCVDPLIVTAPAVGIGLADA